MFFVRVHSQRVSGAFMDVFILKEVKVVCFDTLLQVLILGDLQGSAKLENRNWKMEQLGDEWLVASKLRREGWARTVLAAAITNYINAYIPFSSR